MTVRNIPNAKELRRFRSWLDTFVSEERWFDRAKRDVMHAIDVAIGREMIREHFADKPKKRRAKR